MSPKNQKAYLSLRDRLILNFVILGVVIILVIGSFSYYTARAILLDRTFEQLTSVRVVKKRQIESFFADRVRDIKLLSSSPETIELLQLTDDRMSEQDLAKDVFRIYDTYLSRYLSAQGYYTSFFIASDDGSGIQLPTTISDTNVIGLFGEAVPLDLTDAIFSGKDICILDLKKGTVAQGLYIGAPIREDEQIIGLVALEISLDAINKIMYENNPYEGLGESGESYLVGDDMLMRSISRFQDNSILNTRVATEGVEQAFLGIDSIGIIDDYRGIEVLSSYSPVDINDLHWVILAEIDLNEALIPLNAIRNNILLISSFIVLFLFLVAVLISARISFPIIRLKKATERIGEGEFDTGIETALNNEIGDLTRSFNTMSNKLSEKTSELRKERIRRLRSVIDGQEIERQRLSRELHDGLGQMLIALKLKLENIKASRECNAMETITDVKSSFNITIDEVRRMSNDLMPAVLYEFGILTALRTLVDTVSENASIHGKFIPSGKDDKLDKTIKTYIYRIAQEALNNSVKHANASIVELAIRIDDDMVFMTIEDDGIGFDITNESVAVGNGLHNMRERTGLLHGTMEIGHGSNGGTLVTVNIPINTNNL